MGDFCFCALLDESICKFKTKSNKNALHKTLTHPNTLLRQKKQTWVRSVQFPTASLQKVTGNNTTVIEIPISTHIQQEKIDILFVFLIFSNKAKHAFMTRNKT